MNREYIVVTQHGDAIGIVTGLLCDEINNFMKEGYMPIGGISIVVVDDVVIANQAMLYSK